MLLPTLSWSLLLITSHGYFEYGLSIKRLGWCSNWEDPKGSCLGAGCDWSIHMQASPAGSLSWGVSEAPAGLWQEAGRYQLKAWKDVRELKLDVQEAEVRQTLTGKIARKVKRKKQILQILVIRTRSVLRPFLWPQFHHTSDWAHLNQTYESCSFIQGIWPKWC